MLVFNIAFRYLRHRTSAAMVSFPIALVLAGLIMSGIAIVLTCSIQQGIQQKLLKSWDILDPVSDGRIQVSKEDWTAQQHLQFNEAMKQDARFTQTYNFERLPGLLNLSGPRPDSADPVTHQIDAMVVMMAGTPKGDGSMGRGLWDLQTQKAKEAFERIVRDGEDGKTPRIWMRQRDLNSAGLQPGDQVAFWAGRVSGDPLHPQAKAKAFTVVGALPDDVAWLYSNSSVNVVGDATAMAYAAGVRRGPAMDTGLMVNDTANMWQSFSFDDLSLPASKILVSKLTDAGMSQAQAEASVGRSVLDDMPAIKEKLEKDFQLQSLVATLILGLILAACAVQMISALGLLVQARRREIAVLRSMGLSSVAAGGIFLATAFLIGLIGLFFGGLIGVILGVHLNAILEFFLSGHADSLKLVLPVPVIFPVERLITIGFFGLTVCCLAALWPAWRAAQIDPAQVFAEED